MGPFFIFSSLLSFIHFFFLFFFLSFFFLSFFLSFFLYLHFSGSPSIFFVVVVVFVVDAANAKAAVVFSVLVCEFQYFATNIKQVTKTLQLGMPVSIPPLTRLLGY